MASWALTVQILTTLIYFTSIMVPLRGTSSGAGRDGDAATDALLSASSAAASTQRLCALTSGVLVFHVLTSALQERVFHLPGFTNVLLLSFGETLCTAVLAALQLFLGWWWRKEKYEEEEEERRERSEVFGTSDNAGLRGMRANALVVSPLKEGYGPWCGRMFRVLQRIFHPSTVELRWYVWIAFLMSCSLYLTNQTSLILSYPLQVIFKSSKLLCMVVVRRWWMRAESAMPDSDGEEERRGDTHAATHSCNQWRGSAGTDVSGTYAHAAALPSSSSLCSSPLPVNEGAVHVAVPASCSPVPYAAKDPRVDLTSDVTSPRTRTQHRERVSKSHHRWTGVSTEREARGAMARVGWWAEEVLRLIGSLWRYRQLPQRLQHLRLRVQRRHGLCSTALRDTVAALRHSCCTRRGAIALFRLAAQRVREFLRDGELQACTVIVLGLILFTYASRVDEGALSTVAGDGAAVWSTSAPTSTVAENAQGTARMMLRSEPPHPSVMPPQPAQQQQHQLHNASHPALFTASAPTSLCKAWAVLSDWYLLWTATLIGVVGVLISNLIDTVIYMLEEVYCFQTAGEDPPGPGAGPSSNAEQAVKKSGSCFSETKADAVHVVCDAESPTPPPTCVAVSPIADTFLSAMRHGEDNRLKLEVAKDGSVHAEMPGLHPTALMAAAGEASGTPSRAPSAPAWQGAARRSQADLVIGNIDAGVPATPRQASILSSPSTPSLPLRIPATSLEVLLMLNGIASVLYAIGLVLPRLLPQHGTFLFPSAAPAATAAATTATSPPAFPLVTFVWLILLASATSLVGTLCLLSIVAEYTGVMAVVVTSMRKTLTILLSYVVYGRRFTPVHAVGLAGVMGGVVWNELLRRQRAHVKS